MLSPFAARYRGIGKGDSGKATELAKSQLARKEAAVAYRIGESILKPETFVQFVLLPQPKIMPKTRESQQSFLGSCLRVLRPQARPREGASCGLKELRLDRARSASRSL